VRQRDQVVATEFEKRLIHSHNELRAHLDRMHHAILARLAEIETRIPAAGAAQKVEATPVDVPPRDRVPL